MESNKRTEHAEAHRSASISRPAKADQMKVQLGRPDMVDFINRSARASPVRMTELTEVLGNRSASMMVAKKCRMGNGKCSPIVTYRSRRCSSILTTSCSARDPDPTSKLYH